MTAAEDTTTGPSPPFDPELTAALAAVSEIVNVSPGQIGRVRERLGALFPVPTEEDLGRGGSYDVLERAVPGPTGGPDVVLLLGGLSIDRICTWLAPGRIFTTLPPRGGAAFAFDATAGRRSSVRRPGGPAALDAPQPVITAIRTRAVDPER